MRMPIALPIVGSIFLLAVPTLALAQFQPVNPDELKMTSDPKAPGAAAVYLEIRQVEDDNLHYESHYARIKVLTEKGKELATVELPYVIHNYKITDIKGRTIHADGTEVPLNVKPEDLLLEKSGEVQVNRKVFTLPSVEVGSVLEYTWTLRYDDNSYSSPEWEVQLPYFVHKAHYQFLPFKAFLPNSNTSMYLEDEDGDILNDILVWWRLPSKDMTVNQVPSSGLYSLDVTDIPAAPDEEWMPPTNSFLYKVSFYYKDNNDSARWWLEAGKRWTKRVNRFADPKPLQSAVASLVAPTDSELDKAQKIYKAVQALDNTDFSRARSESERKELHMKEQKRAEDTWTQKSGSSTDIALLYLAMLRAAGLNAEPVTLADRSERTFDLSYLSLSQLTDTLVILKTGDKETSLDPGEKMCPFGVLAWKHAGSAGLLEGDHGVAVATMPYSAYSTNSLSRTGDLTLDSHGGVSGRLQFLLSGQQALYWRQKALRNDGTELKKQFDKEELESEVPDGVEAHIDHFLGMDDPDVNLIAVVGVTGNLGVATSKRMILPAYFFQSRGRTPFVKEEKREMAVDMHYGDRITDQIVYHLPDGVTVEGAPQDANIPWQGHAVYTAKSKTDPSQITITRAFTRAFTFAKPEEYQNLRAFYQKVAAADQGQIVLAAQVAAKGN